MRADSKVCTKNLNCAKLCQPLKRFQNKSNKMKVCKTLVAQGIIRLKYCWHQHLLLYSRIRISAFWGEAAPLSSQYYVIGLTKGQLHPEMCSHTPVTSTPPRCMASTLSLCTVSRWLLILGMRLPSKLTVERLPSTGLRYMCCLHYCDCTLFLSFFLYIYYT